MTEIDRDRWIELNRLGLEAFYRLNVGNVESSQLIEQDGLVAAIVPGAPERSVFNGVVYSDGAALRESLEELARAYEEAGVIAWTVWVPEEDDAAAELLEAAGHRLDADPRAMGTELDGFPEPDLSGLDWTREVDLETVALVNDHAYGYPDGTFAAGMGAQAPPELQLYLARLNGDPAATVATVDVDGDCTVWCVATDR